MTITFLCQYWPVMMLSENAAIVALFHVAELYDIFTCKVDSWWHKWDQSISTKWNWFWCVLNWEKFVRIVSCWPTLLWTVWLFTITFIPSWYLYLMVISAQVGLRKYELKFPELYSWFTSQLNSVKFVSSWVSLNNLPVYTVAFITLFIVENI